MTLRKISTEACNRVCSPFYGIENFLDVEKKADHVYTLVDGTAFKTAMDLEGKEYAATIRPDDICLADETAF